MTDQYQEVAHYLLEIEIELRRLNFWQESHPDMDDLASELPFCHDTLEFPHWLQFVFIKKMKMLLETNSPLPTVCGITPYAEEYFLSSGQGTKILLEHLAAIDKLLSSN